MYYYIYYQLNCIIELNNSSNLINKSEIWLPYICAPDVIILTEYGGQVAQACKL